ncbi:hypothetical protein E6O75_ATG05147 [Venturia nashicola]|uniref:Uncharacterized protein n=1 Tax=Venturia nashicola TaxID=86259 RepID=A0A4Z1P068_9PEZI|nr:hypothetical protein E6O75_ATG05147 [Venturia nashicola]
MIATPKLPAVGTQTLNVWVVINLDSPSLDNALFLFGNCNPGNQRWRRSHRLAIRLHTYVLASSQSSGLEIRDILQLKIGNGLWVLLVFGVWCRRKLEAHFHELGGPHTLAFVAKVVTGLSSTGVATFGLGDENAWRTTCDCACVNTTADGGSGTS